MMTIETAVLVGMGLVALWGLVALFMAVKFVKTDNDIHNINVEPGSCVAR